jgi:hypothetical protein
MADPGQYRPEPGCTGKVRYLDARTAKGAARGLRAWYERKGPRALKRRINVYRCKYCGWFHVGKGWVIEA